MIVTICFAIVATGAVAKIYLVNQPGLFQVAQRVVNGCVADTGQALAGRFEDVACSRMVVAFLDDLKDRLSLRRQLWFWLCLFHDGFRLILNHGFVKPRITRIKATDFLLVEIDDPIDIAFEGRATNAHAAASSSWAWLSRRVV